MTLRTLTLSMTLLLFAGSAWATPAAETANVPEQSLSSISAESADESPEWEAEREESIAKWEADARAAGLDPDKEEAKSEPELRVSKEGSS